MPARPRSSSPRSLSLAGRYQAVVAEVYEAAGVLRRYGERIAGVADQTQARWQLMSVVSEGNWTVPAVAGRLGVSRQAIQRLTNELVAGGLARFATNPRHRGSPFVHLSEAGMDTLAVIRARAATAHATLATDLQHEGLDLDSLCADMSLLTRVVRSRLEPYDAVDTAPS